MQPVAHRSLGNLRQQGLSIAQQQLVEGAPALELLVHDGGPQAEPAPGRLDKGLAGRRGTTHEEGDPYHALASDYTHFTSQAIGERVDERYHGSGGEIQKRWGAIRVVEHIAERPCARFEV